MDKETQNAIALHERELALLRERIDRTYTQLYAMTPAGGGMSGAPTDAPYLVASLDVRLDAERALAAGWAISLTDGGGGGSMTIAVNQTTLDGRYLRSPMAADLNMGGYAITSVGNVDGVDVSALYTDFSNHILAPDAHHAPVTAGDGIDVSVGGQQVSVDVTDFIDTAAGLKEDASNNIQLSLASPSGLSFSSGALQLDDSVAGNGLTVTSKVLAVGAGTLITVGADTVGITPGAPHQFIGMGTGTEASWQDLSIPAGAEFHVDGALSVITSVAGVWIASCVGTITKVYIHCQNTGSSGETIVDINKNGTTIFTTQSNRPKLLAGASSPVAEAIPDVVALAERDVLSVDIDSVAAGASGLSVLVAIEMSESAGGMSFSIGGVISTSSFTSDGLEESPVAA